MRRSSGRGYVEPIAAIAAIFAVGVGLTLYSGVLAGTLDPSDRTVAETALDDLRYGASERGVLDPVQVLLWEGPAGWSSNVTLATEAGRWTRGPTPPEDAVRTTRRVGVRLGPSRIRPGRLTVVVWR